MIGGAEALAGHDRHVRLPQQSLGELHRAGDAVLAQRAPYIRIRVECALGLGAVDTTGLVPVGL